ncbi:hypothetical protein [Trujillonella humicola]|uniref:hypothetical protein n=1 Tax=Trujillonella humicola TaxID=3383699 RepID=UPI0039059C6A
MEYTSLLAGEPFGDRPRCVDDELGDVLRAANDRMTDAERPLLVPLLGRAIGLAVPAPPPGPRGLRRGALRHRREVLAPHREAVARLRRAAARRYSAAIGPSSVTRRAFSGRAGELAEVFWDTLPEPVPPTTPSACAERLVERLRLLHEAYEGAMADTGVPRPVPPSPSPAPPVVPVPRRPLP